MSTGTTASERWDVRRTWEMTEVEAAYLDSMADLVKVYGVGGLWYLSADSARGVALLLHGEVTELEVARSDIVAVDLDRDAVQVAGVGSPA